ncbi:MAG: carboxypeptidase-like regulatory domain-containing protein, partial [Prevotella sp.]
MLLGLLIPLGAVAQKKGSYTLDLTVKDKDTKEAVIMATIQLQPTGAMAVTDMNGRASVKNVEAGTYTVNISYVGYEPVSTQVKVSKNVKLDFQMVPTTLALNEVIVTAKQNAAGAATSSIIGRQAIDHLQASSLADVLQLLPGQLMTNTDLTSQSNLQVRTLSNNNTAAFGSSVILDGVPQSTNANVSAGGFSATSFTGTDLRNFSADDVQEVEVIRGIPSAEYGDLT